MAEQWEYETEMLTPDDIPSQLNARGEAGWELVSLAPDKMERTIAMFGWGVKTTEYQAIFKRRKP